MFDRSPDHLTIAEHAALEREIRSRRTDDTLVEGRWSVSPLNRAPDVLAAPLPARLPSRVTVRDITLRTIEQAPGVMITRQQRREIADALNAARVGSIQIAWLSVPHAGADPLAEEVRYLRSLRSDVEVCGLGAGREQVEAGIRAGVDLFHVYGPVVAAFNTVYGPFGRLILRAQWRGEDWRTAVPYPRNESEQLATFQTEIRRLKDAHVKAGAFASLLHYALPEEVERFAAAAAAAGADEIMLGDGASGLGPQAWAYLIGLVRGAAPGIPVGIHAHNGFGLAMANVIASFHAGAEVAEVSVNGLCSGTGHADLGELAAALEVIYGVRTGIALEGLTALSRLVEDVSGKRTASNKPITSEDAWTYTEEGTREVARFGVHKVAEPRVFGNRDRYTLGAHSGSWSVLGKLNDVGLRASEEAIPRILDAVKSEILTRGRALEDDEIAAIAHRHGAEA